MKSAWRRSTIGESCEILNGGTPKTNVAEYWEGSHQWVTPAEMGKRADPYIGESERTLTDAGLANSSAKLLPPRSVILSSRAPIGHLVINTVPMAFNQGCRGLAPGESLHYKFLYYYLYASVDLLDSLGTGATFKELSASRLKDVAIPLPPLAEQKRIVAILDQAFAAIATATAHAQKNLTNARELFDSELNAIVQGEWDAAETVSLSHLATDITDGDHLPPPKSADGVPFITIGNIIKATRQVDFSDTFKVPRAYFDGLKPNRRPRKGDVLYTVTGSFGIPVIIDDEREFCFQRHIGLIRPRSDVDTTWLYYVLSSPRFFKQASAQATGTAQKTVSLRVLRGLKVPDVPLQRQRAASQRLKVIGDRTQSLASIYERKLAALAELKQSILHKAFSGELTAARGVAREAVPA